MQPTVFESTTEAESLFCPEPGIYPGISFDEYCQWDAVNHSRLQRIDKSPLHCRELPSFEKSAAIRLGQLVHCGQLEPKSVDARYVVMPQFELMPENVTDKGAPSTSTSTTFCKNARAAFISAAIADRKTVVSQSEYEQYKSCLNAILKNQRAADFVNESQTEVSIVWHDRHTGLRCKARIDILGTDRIGDLKTSRDDGPSPLPIGFEYSLHSYNYYSQAAFYQEGWATLTGKYLPFWFVVVSTTPPIQCIAAPVGEMSLSLGRDKNQERLSMYARCCETGIWPGYESPEIFELPEKYFPSEVNQ